jgi:hypothetical protein
MLILPTMRKIVQTPGLVVILSECNLASAAEQNDS